MKLALIEKNKHFNLPSIPMLFTERYYNLNKFWNHWKQWTYQGKEKSTLSFIESVYDQ